MINEETNVESAITVDSTILTQETYENLDKMFKGDAGDVLMAQLAVTKLNFEKSIYFIYLLTKSHVHRLFNARTKAGRTVRDECNIWRLYGMNEYSFAHHLINKGWMTPEIFMKLKKPILKYTNVHNYFYNYHVTLKPQYHDLDKDHGELITLNDVKHD